MTDTKHSYGRITGYIPNPSNGKRITVIGTIDAEATVGEVCTAVREWKDAGVMDIRFEWVEIPRRITK